MCCYTTRHFTELCDIAWQSIIDKHVLLNDKTLYGKMCYCTKIRYTNQVSLHDTILSRTMFYCTKRHYTEPCVIAWQSIIKNHDLFQKTTLKKYVLMHKSFKEICITARKDIKTTMCFFHDTTLYRTMCCYIARHYNGYMILHESAL